MFLAWEAQHDARLAEACSIGSDETLLSASAVDAAFPAHRARRPRVLPKPCTSRTAAMVKLRTLHDPEVGHFSCVECEHDDTALQQELAVLDDQRGEWTISSSPQAFPVALATWRDAGEIIARSMPGLTGKASTKVLRSTRPGGGRSARSQP